MADFVLEARMWLPRPRREVFAFIADARNLAEVNPPSTDLRWLQPPPAALEAGSVLEFSMRALGLRYRWRVLIRELDRPYHFVDVQVRGPFARWEHRHRFLEGPEAPDGDGPVGTWMEDRVTYRLPLGPLGRLFHALFGRRQIARLFGQRQQRLREMLALTPTGPV
jgi:hypothetical protein